MNYFRIFFFILSLIVSLSGKLFSAACNPFLDPPFSNSTISSDFGPRNVKDSFFHRGLDYAQSSGTAIPAVEGGEILAIKGDTAGGGYRIQIKGNETGRIFIYMHMFSDGNAPQTSGDFELGQDSAGNFFIRRISDNKILQVESQVTKRELIGPVGTSGNVTGPHLHLQVGPDDKGGPDSPFCYITHEASAFEVEIHSLADGQVIMKPHPTCPQIPIARSLNFTINSSKGLDLDKVLLRVAGSNFTVPTGKPENTVAFGYGGRPDEDLTTSAEKEEGEKGVSPPAPFKAFTGADNVTFKVNPIELGKDNFTIGVT